MFGLSIRIHLHHSDKQLSQVSDVLSVNQSKKLVHLSFEKLSFSHRYFSGTLSLIIIIHMQAHHS